MITTSITRKMRAGRERDGYKLDDLALLDESFERIARLEVRGQGLARRRMASVTAGRGRFEVACPYNLLPV
jgi:hypothetical protein